MDKVSQISQKLAPVLEKLDAALVRQFPNVGERSEVIQLVRRTIASEGLPGIRQLVDKGILPSIVLGLLGAGMSDGQ